MLKYYDFMASYRKAGTCFEYTDEALSEAAIHPWMSHYAVTFHQASALPRTLKSTLKVSRTAQLCCQWPHSAWKLDKNVFGKKTQRGTGSPIQLKVTPRWGWWDKCTLLVTRIILTMAAHTPLIYSIGAAHLVTSPAERGMCQAGTFFQRKLCQQHPL